MCRAYRIGDSDLACTAILHKYNISIVQLHIHFLMLSRYFFHCLRLLLFPFFILWLLDVPNIFSVPHAQRPYIQKHWRIQKLIFLRDGAFCKIADHFWDGDQLFETEIFVQLGLQTDMPTFFCSHFLLLAYCLGDIAFYSPLTMPLHGTNEKLMLL